MRSVVKPLSLLGLILLAPVVSACAGFTPLYAERVKVNLAQVGIEVPQTRTGYFLEQDLRNGFGGDVDTPKLYNLKVNLAQRHYAIGYRVDETSTRSEITGAVAYVLTDLRTGKTVTAGKFTETVTYTTTASPFTGIVSQQDAEERIALAVSQKIQTDLALFFHSKPAS